MTSQEEIRDNFIAILQANSIETDDDYASSCRAVVITGFHSKLDEVVNQTLSYLDTKGVRMADGSRLI